jgi:hypothetical protein
MAEVFYFAAWTDSGCLMGCDHEHETVISATNCISVAGSYVIAVENGEYRALHDREEAEFQYALYGGERTAHSPLVPGRVPDLLLN